MTEWTPESKPSTNRTPDSKLETEGFSMVIDNDLNPITDNDENIIYCEEEEQ